MIPKTIPDWQHAFCKAVGNMEAGLLAFDNAWVAAVGTTYSNKEVLDSYLTYLQLGRPALTQEELVNCLYNAAAMGFSVWHVLDRAELYKDQKLNAG